MKLLTALFDRVKLPATPQMVLNLGNWESLPKVIESIESSNSVVDLTYYLSQRSGYIREAAIARCLELSLPELLPPVFDRLNDFVPEIRRAARSAILTMLATIPASQFMGSLPKVYALHAATRTDHTDWIKQFERAFVQVIGVDPLVQAVKGGDANIARACFALIRNLQLVAPLVLIELAVLSSDIRLASEAIQYCQTLEQASKLDQLKRLAQSRYGMVRAKCMRLLLSDEFDFDKSAFAQEYLLDAHSGTRDIAFAWLQARDFDLRTFYLDILKAQSGRTRDICASVLAIAKLRDRQSIDMVKAYTESNVAVVRYSALMAWARMESGNLDVAADIALKDTSPRVRKLTGRLVLKHGAYVGFDTIKECISVTADIELLLRLSAISKWNWLECLTIMSNDPQILDREGRRLSGELQKWIATIARSYELPTARQVQFFSLPENLKVLQTLRGNSRPIITEVIGQHFPILRT
jgi:HEAT repeat protein